MDTSKTNEQLNYSSRSDISAFTDMKVFQGHFGGIDLFKKLNEDPKKNNTTCNNNINQQVRKSKINMNSTAYLSKLNEYKDETSNCNNDHSPELFLLKSLPLESPMNIDHNDFLSFGTCSELPGKQNFPIANNIDEDNRSNNSKQSRKSKKSNMSLNDPQNEENTRANNNPIKAFITTLNDEEDTCFQSEGGSQPNLFWVLGQSNTHIEGNSANPNNKKEVLEQAPIKTFKEIANSFTIAKIDKGMALLVSSNDCIFTLPTFLLPLGARIGNTYNLSIGENSTLFEQEIKLQLMQKRLFNNQNSDKNANVIS